MYELTPDNIARISRDVRMQEITFSHLADELIDHICCDVEFEMDKGMGFSEAYEVVKGRMGERRLKEIQEDTLYAVDTKYRKMKRTMKISAVAGTALLGVAAMFKIMHWPGAGIMMTLGAIALAFVFLPSSLTVLWKESHSGKRLFLFITAFFAGVFFILGILFKIQHWPMAGLALALAYVTAIFFFVPALLISRLKTCESRQQKAIYIIGAVGLVFYILGLFFKIQHYPGSGLTLMAGVVIIFFVVFPWYSYVRWREEHTISGGFLFLVIGSIGIVVPSLLVSLNMQRSYEDSFYFHQRQQSGLYDYLSESNRKYLSSCNDTVMTGVMDKVSTATGELLATVTGIEQQMVAEAEGVPGKPADTGSLFHSTQNGTSIRYNLLRRPFENTVYRRYLTEGTDDRKTLDDALGRYAAYIISLSAVTDSMSVASMLDTDVYFPEVTTGEGQISLMTALHMTALLKNSILAVEAGAYKSIADGEKNKE